MSKNRFTWGDSVRVVKADGICIDWRPGSLGSICGLRTIENEKGALSSSFTVGTIVYTVEFADGESQQIPEEALESVD